MTKRQSILVEVGNERVRQEQKWDVAHYDDTYGVPRWDSLIVSYSGLAVNADYDDNPGEVRQRFIQVAALAVAAVEALDRERLLFEASSNS